MFCGIIRDAAVIGIVFTLATADCNGVPHKSNAGPAANPGSTIVWNFDKVEIGGLPQAWKIDSTNLRGRPATWKVIEDKSAPSGGKALALTKTNHSSGGTFNLCRTDAVKMLDGEIEVSFKPVSGQEDQGGGIMWRVQDGDNYYVARFNPLEDNLRVYYVRKAIRKMIKGCTVTLPPGKWHKMKVVQNGSRFEVYLNDRLMLKGENSVFTEAGGVGLWTKADAVTSFDDFKVLVK